METYDGPVPNGIVLDDLTLDINTKVNGVLAQARALPKSPLEKTKFIYDQLGKPQFPNFHLAPIEAWANGLLQATQGRAGKIYTPSLADSQYKESKSLMTTTFAPVITIDTTLMGTDKLGHLFQLGYHNYFELVHNGKKPVSTQKAIEAGDETELNEYGLVGTSVYSRADLEANHAGLKFYEAFFSNQNITFDIRSYVNANWNETSNNNFYTEGLGRTVWRTLLERRWTGKVHGNWRNEVSWPTSPNRTVDFAFQPQSDTMSDHRNKVVRVAGTFVYHHVQSDFNGRLNGQFTFQSRADLNGAISGIVLEFQWDHGGMNGRGKFTSQSENQMTGTFDGQDGDNYVGGTCELKRI